METFFVTYTTGEYDFYQEHIYTFDAQSKEHLEQEIKDAWLDYYNYQQEYNAEYEKLVKQHRPKREGGREVTKQEWTTYAVRMEKFSQKYPFISRLTVFGKHIAPFDFAISDADKVYEKQCVQIWTVEEYIEACRPPRC